MSEVELFTQLRCNTVSQYKSVVMRTERSEPFQVKCGRLSEFSFPRCNLSDFHNIVSGKKSSSRQQTPPPPPHDKRRQLNVASGKRPYFQALQRGRCVGKRVRYHVGIHHFARWTLPHNVVDVLVQRVRYHVGIHHFARWTLPHNVVDVLVKEYDIMWEYIISPDGHCPTTW
ncbi:hypothetical protein J6590_025145 [Homalodisca vitripennis]|nr:hypothetical protein J6590_025145 [Homalodisca vitripennis]